MQTPSSRKLFVISPTNFKHFKILKTFTKQNLLHAKNLTKILAFKLNLKYYRKISKKSMYNYDKQNVPFVLYFKKTKGYTGINWITSLK